MTYGSLICTKTLRIIGNGFYHLANANIISQPFFQGESVVGGITVNSTAPSTIIEGLYPGTCYIKAQNVKITRCLGGNFFLIRDNLGSNASGAIITKNINFGLKFTGYYENSPSPSCASVDYQIENVIIKNNLNVTIDWSNSAVLRRGGSCSVSNSYQVPSLKNSTISNNTNYSVLELYGENTVVHSNICSSLNISGTYAYPSNYVTASKNVCNVVCGYGANNLDNIALNTLFTSSNPSLDSGFRLSATSPAIGAGLGGIDAGAYGGSDPYRISGLAPIPQITSYSKNASSGVYTTTTPMTVTISVRGNN
jgi:hypothetical protein